MTASGKCIHCIHGRCQQTYTMGQIPSIQNHKRPLVEVHMGGAGVRRPTLRSHGFLTVGGVVSWRSVDLSGVIGNLSGIVCWGHIEVMLWKLIRGGT